MIIPGFTEKSERDQFVKYINDTCLSSRQDRRNLYDRRKRYFMFGTFNEGQARYNRLKAHMDLVSSFLFAADHCKFEIAPPINSQPELHEKFAALREEWNDDFRDTGLAYLFPEALLWSLVFDTVVLKPGWSENKDQVFASVVLPYNFGVYQEDVPDLDDQEAMCHIYNINYDNAVLRLTRAGKASDIPKLAVGTANDDTMLPPILQQLLIAQTGGANLAGNIVGQANVDYEPTATYEAKVRAPTVEMKETWVWDDQKNDYCIFHSIEENVISDSREVASVLRKEAAAARKNTADFSDNYYLPGEHAFVQVAPYRLLDYFWGEAAIDKLIPLQKWTNERLDQIAEILDRQADPAKVFAGFMGLQDEKAAALGGPGTYVIDPMPQAQVKELAPEMPPDLFQEVTAIGQIFLEASGLTETTAGHGEAGVRSKGHAKELKTTGSARIRKIAVGVEEPLAKLAHLSIKLKMKNDDTVISDDKQKKFYAANLASTRWKIRVAGHSHSPLFSDDAKEFAMLGIKAQAIDGEMFIRLFDPPNADSLIAALRERQKERMQKLARTPPPGTGGAKGKRGTNGTSVATAP